jgi:hypothetical protein
MPAPQGHPKWGGRAKGTPNKVTASAKEAITLAFDNIGGVDALTEWAKTNQDAFYTKVWPKVLPLQLAGDPENPLVSNSRKSALEEPDATLKWLQNILAESRAKQEREAREQQDSSLPPVTRIAGNA